MPLPHYSNSIASQTNLVYPNLYELILVTKDYNLRDYSYKVSYINTQLENKINISFTIEEKHLEHLNFSDFLKDIMYVVHIVYGKTGNVLKQSLISVKFVSSEINFSYNDSSILEIKLDLDNISCEEITIPVSESYIKSIQRDFKLNSIL